MSLADRLFVVRPSGAADYSLVVDSFKRNVAKEHAASGRKRWKIAESYRALLDRILWLPETSCRVLAAKDNTGHVAGWVAYTPVGPDIVAVHYAYVKWNYRPLELGEDLFRLTGARGKRLAWTFDCRLAHKLAARLVASGEVSSAWHLPAAEFLEDMGESDERREAQA